MAIPKFLMKAVCLIVMLLGFGYEVTIAERFAPREECSPDQSESLIPCKVRVLSYNVHGISPILNFSYVGVPVRDNDSRSGLMAWLLMDYDLILLQEDFEFHRQIVDEFTYELIEHGNGPRIALAPLWLVTKRRCRSGFSREQGRLTFLIVLSLLDIEGVGSMQ